MMSGSKAPDSDAYGLFRATHSHNPTLYSHTVGLSSHFYAHIGAGQNIVYHNFSKKGEWKYSKICDRIIIHRLVRKWMERYLKWKRYRRKINMR